MSNAWFNLENGLEQRDSHHVLEPNECNYYQHEGHMVFDYPFIEEFVCQGLVNHVMNYVHNKLSLENPQDKKVGWYHA
jgi:hypothetical protein